MEKLILDPSLRTRLNNLDAPVEFCDEGGRTLGHFLPEGVYKELMCSWANAQVTDEELWRRSAGGRPREPFFEPSKKVNVRRCQAFLEDLRRQEDCLQKRQVETAQDLLQVQAARRAFEETLKEMLRTEGRFSAPDQGAELHATEEEVVAGLQELKEHGGLELHQFIGELEQVLHDRERDGN